MLSTFFTGIMNSRISRMRYLAYVVALFLIFFVALILFMVIASSGMVDTATIENLANTSGPLPPGFVIIYPLIGFISLNLAVKRARDIGLVGGNLFIFAIVIMVSGGISALADDTSLGYISGWLHSILVFLLMLIPGNALKKSRYYNAQQPR